MQGRSAAAVPFLAAGRDCRVHRASAEGVEPVLQCAGPAERQATSLSSRPWLPSLQTTERKASVMDSKRERMGMQGTEPEAHHGDAGVVVRLEDDRRHAVDEDGEVDAAHMDVVDGGLGDVRATPCFRSWASRRP